MAAAAGGVTTLLLNTKCNPAVYNADMLRNLVEVITTKSYVDFGIWGLNLGDLNNADLRA